MDYDSSDRTFFRGMVWGIVWRIVSTGRWLGMLFCVMAGPGAERRGFGIHRKGVELIAGQKEFYQI